MIAPTCRLCGGGFNPDEEVYASDWNIIQPDGTHITFWGNQTMSQEHIEWFRAGSALNIIRSRTA